MKNMKNMRTKIIQSPQRYPIEFEKKMNEFLKDKDTFSVQFKPDNGILIAMILYPEEE